MDPKAINTLDPKLQDTYNRVMGTTTTQPANGAFGATATVQPVTPTASQATTNPQAGPQITHDIPQNPTPPLQTSYTNDNLSFQAAIQTPQVSPAQASAGVVVPHQSSTSLLRVLYVVIAVVFFVVYTIVWVKIFNLPLPF